MGWAYWRPHPGPRTVAKLRPIPGETPGMCRTTVVAASPKCFLLAIWRQLVGGTRVYSAIVNAIGGHVSACAGPGLGVSDLAVSGADGSHGY